MAFVQVELGVIPQIKEQNLSRLVDKNPTISGGSETKKNNVGSGFLRDIPIQSNRSNARLQV